MYIQSDNIIVYPTVNSRDFGKVNSEYNLTNIVTRITQRNYTVGDTSLILSKASDNSVYISPGEANIEGYDIQISNQIELAAPTILSASTEYEVLVYLNRDLTGVLFGDVADNSGVSYYEGLDVDFRNPNDPNDPLHDKDGLILGKVITDESGIISIVEPNKSLNMSIDGDNVIIDGMTLKEYLEKYIFVDDGCIDHV